jgi:predicted O-linked N-acetylglucosamine transferase (SPINDLY family)
VPDPVRRLRVGYVSADFVRHPVGYFIEAVLKAHDRAQVEIFCYSNAWRTDPLTQRLYAVADHWRTIAWKSDLDVANMIRSDEIDILVDLSGHTAGHRLQLFGHKPAPVQATWLGYFGTTGLAAIDYILVDEVISSRSDEDQFVETPVRLPHGYLCYAPREAVPVRAAPAERLGFATFGCFNKLIKVTPAVITVWAEILRRIPTARLVLKDAALEDPDVRTRCLAKFVSEGVATHRLDLLGRSEHIAYLDAYNHIDIALDPFPFNGGTTTAEALWMGVPVVTLRGDHFVSRLGASLLTGLGARELIADSRQQYVEIATTLANDVPRLVALRAGLRDRLLTSSLCDGPGFTRGLEAAYRRLWQPWCAAQTGGVTHR